MTPTRRALLGSTLLYMLLALLITWPVAARLTTHVAGEAGGDSLQFVWNLWWVEEALLRQGVGPATVTMLHWPVGGTNHLLALSILVPLLALPTTLLVGPVASYNLWFLLSFVLAGVGGWLLTAHVTGDRRAALIGGLVFGFFPHKSMQGTHHYLQIMVFLFPLYTLALLRLLRQPSPRRAWQTGLLLGLSLLVNLVHIGFFLLPLSVLLLGAHLLTDRAWWRRRGPLWLGVALALALLIAAPALLPFLRDSLGGGLAHYQQPGVVSFSTDLLAYLTPSPDHPLLQNEAFREWSRFLRRGNVEENVAYLGLTTLLLAALGLVRRPRAAAPWALVAAVMLVLALGPLLKIGGTIVGEGQGPMIDGVRSTVRLPYAALMRLPFYEWGRIPNRQAMTAMLALAVLAGLGIASLGHRPRLATGVTGVVVVALALEFLVAWPYPTGSAALVRAPVWGEIRAEARGAVLDLPQWDFFGFPPSNEALLAQTAHGQPIVGGYIHRLPPGSAETARTIQELVVPPAPRDIVPRPTGEAALTALRGLGIATVVLHHDARSGVWTDTDDAAATARLRQWAGAPRWTGGALAVYDLPGPPASPPALWSLSPHWHTVEGLPESARRWMPGEAEVWLWLPAAQRTPLRLDAQGFNGPRTLTISVDDATVWAGTVEQRTLVETPPLTLAAGFHRVHLVLAEGCQRPTELDPAASDARCLGLLVYGIEALGLADQAAATAPRAGPRLPPSRR